MADFIISTNVTTAQILSGIESGIVTQNGSIAVLGANAITTTSNNDVIVNGTVATDSNAIYSTGASLGLIVGSSGNILSTGTYGVVSDVSSGTEVVNNGTISATGTGVRQTSSDTSAQHQLTNTGTISGGANGVWIEARGVSSFIVNSGTITGANYGVIGGDIADAVFKVFNTGTIVGDLYSFFGNYDDGSGTSSDRVYNAGLMQGDITLLSGDDIYKGRLGFVSGDIVGDDGDDILKGGAGAEVLYGGDDDDILSGW
ncbi:MAG: hypothetical protein GY947_07125, partial [Rhodobacteraceae bacterium]|nr:hypothetical protein [Paracoccaceae bacterium]